MHPLDLAGPSDAGGGAGGGGERNSEGSGGGGAVARLLALAERLAEVEAAAAARGMRGTGRARGAPRVTLLSFEPDDARVVLALDELRDAGSFEALFRAQVGHAQIQIQIQVI